MWLSPLFPPCVRGGRGQRSLSPATCLCSRTKSPTPPARRWAAACPPRWPGRWWGWTGWCCGPEAAGPNQTRSFSQARYSYKKITFLAIIWHSLKQFASLKCINCFMCACVCMFKLGVAKTSVLTCILNHSHVKCWICKTIYTYISMLPVGLDVMPYWLVTNLTKGGKLCVFANSVIFKGTPLIMAKEVNPSV